MASTEPTTVLIVEDDASVARLERRRLEAAGYRVVEAATSPEALSRATAGGIDVALIDYSLEGSDTGLALFDAFKAAGLALPVIIVTACTEDDTIIRALRAGVSDFVPKRAAYLDYLPDAIERVLKPLRTEQRLAKSEARFASFMDHSPAITYIKDDQLRLVYVNRLGRQLFELGEYVGQTAFDLLPRDVAESIDETEALVLETGQITEMIHTVPLPDGTLRHWLACRFPIDEAGRRMLGGVAIDVTERVEAERALRNSEARFRSVSESATDAIAAIDQRGQVISWNPSAARLFGYAAEEMLGRPIYCILPQRYREPMRQAVTRVVEQGSERLRDHRQDLYGLRKDGSEFPIELSVGGWKHGGELFFTGIVRDVSDRKRAADELHKRDEQLRHFQRMQSLGTLAGGVAHEFNNLLQSIRGYTQYAMEGLDPADRRHQDLEIALAAAARAESLTRQLLGFGRRRMPHLSDVDPNQVVRDTVCMLRPLVDPAVRIELVLEESVGTLRADHTQLQQLLLNLCLNARDAMPAGGELTIRTAGAMLGAADRINWRELAPGRHLELTVSDTGSGMPPEVLEQAFDPFFTTKEVGKGTGLGLATVYGVVTQHQGAIRVASTLGVGTTFRILLPLAERQPGQVPVVALPEGLPLVGAAAWADAPQPR
jgi:PAS domain S-box-containing protein